MKHLFIYIFISTIWCPDLSAEAHTSETLFLALGTSKSIAHKSQSSVRIGDSKVVRAKASGYQVHLFAQAKGQTSIQIGTQTFLVIVDSENHISFLKSSLDLLSRFMGLSGAIGGDNRLQVNGVLLRISDWINLSELAQRFGARYTFSARIHPSIESQTLELLRELIQPYGLPETSIRLKPRPGIELSVQQKELSDSLLSNTRPFGIPVEVSTQQLSQLPSVEIEAVLAEVDKTFERELGLRWGDAGKYSTQILPSQQWQALSAELTALEARGRGQILAKPRLLSRSGEKAEFHAGGEIPIRMASWGNQNVMWKKHGIILNFQPLADQKGQMKLSIEIEISIPNLSQTVGQLPTFETNRVKSHFDLSKRQTVVISGLVRNSSSELKEGLPYLSQIPILGRLFGSPRYQSRQTELVIFVTPKVIHPNLPHPKPTLPKGVKE